MNRIQARFLIGSLIFCFLTTGGFLYAQESQEPAGKAIFLANKCVTCHSIESMGITKKLASSKAPDLSNVGSERKADWIMKWLKKEETLNDKKHPALFSGSEDDLKTLAAWLETLKKPAEEKK